MARKMKGETAQNQRRHELFAAFALASFCIWLELFHDGGCAFTAVMEDLVLGGHPLGVYLNCFASPLGFALGALYAAACVHAPKLQRAVVRFPLALGVFASLHILFYVLAALGHSYIATSVVSVVVGAVAVSSVLVYCLPCLPFTKRFIVVALIAFIVGHRCAAVALSAVAENRPVLYGALTLLFLIPFAVYALKFCGGAAQATRCDAQEDVGERGSAGEAAREKHTRPESGVSFATSNTPQSRDEERVPRWLRLVLHLVSYGIGFGIIHAMIGFDAAPTMRISQDQTLVSAQLFGCVLAGGLAYLAARYITRVEDMWLIVRGAVFPLLVVGYTLVVITSSAFLPSIIATIGGSIYDVAFFLGCLMMYRETKVGLRTIIGVGFGAKSFGVFIGSVVGFALGDYGAIANQTASAIALLVVFLTLSVGTFWIGSERAMRKWWGLRIEVTPEYQHEQTLHAKCEALAAGHHLSAREAEMLLLVASGKRPTQIAEEQSLSIYTVRNHIQNVYRKLDIHSADELYLLLDNTQVLV